MYTSQMTKTANGIYRIAIYLDGFNVKVIRNRDQSKAIADADYYVKMMRGVNSYTEWLNSRA